MEQKSNIQYAADPDTSPELEKKEKRFIQQVTGTLLYYARAADSTLLTALSTIASQQASPTEATMDKVRQILDYVASQEEAVLTYRASKMILAVHSNAGYLNELEARSRAGGHFYLSTDENFPPNNGAILNVPQIIKHVMSAAAEAELGALFLNAKEAIYIRRMLHEMEHLQPCTPIQTDNSTVEGEINNKIQPKRTKAMDMRFYWLHCQEAQNQFRFFWRPGGQNLADYWTKQHSAAHHQNMRAEFLTKVEEVYKLREKITYMRCAPQRGGACTDVNSIQLQGCVGQTTLPTRNPAGRSPAIF